MFSVFFFTLMDVVAVHPSVTDIWSTGCVMAELMLGQPLFPGESGIDQLVEIIKVLGTPTREQIKTMNPNYMEHKFPQIKAHPFPKVCLERDSSCLDENNTNLMVLVD